MVAAGGDTLKLLGSITSPFVRKVRVVAMELGCDAVLMNTAVAKAADPVRMAEAVGLAARAGRAAYLAGPMQPRFLAGPSSPTEGVPWRP